MDIRQLYNSLSEADQALYQQIRTNIRRIYLHAHTNIVHMENWNNDDDAFMDLLDIKIATLFDRAGAIEGTKTIIDKAEVAKIENKIEDSGKAIATKMITEMSEATNKIKNGAATW